MKKQKSNITAAKKLRHNAEEIYKQRPETGSVFSETDALKMTHELEVHQIELEIQNRELLNARDDLEALVEKFTELYDFAPTAYLTVTGEGRIVQINLCGAEMLGKNRRELTSAYFASFLSPETIKIFNSFLKEIINSKKNKSCEVIIMAGDYQPLTVNMIGNIARDEKNIDINIIDISERKLAEERERRISSELAASNKELSQALQYNTDKDLFISILAHDLRNPFGVLLGYTELLAEDFNTLDPNEIEKLINEIHNCSHVTYTLLEDLLRWSRIRTEKFPFDPQRLNFSEICIDMVTLLNPAASTKDIIIDCSVLKDFYVVADSEMLKAVLRNLISNAVKFSNPNGQIRISAEPIGSEIQFSVSDNGIGIEPERLAKLFDLKEYQSTPGTARERGTGLGLLLCKEFVEKHGGKIWAESEYGKGSVFYFSIPYESEPSLYEKNAHALFEEPAQVKDLKILIVDDDAALRMILSSMVKNYSKEILYAKSGVEALGICSHNPDIDLILMDYHMPELNGYEAARKIRVINKEVIIIAETADTNFDNIDRSLIKGINDFFYKPYNKVFLNQLIIKHFVKPG